MAYYYFIVLLVLISALAKGSIFQTKIFGNFLTVIMLCLTVTIVIMNPLTIDMVRYIGVLEENSTFTLFEAFTRVRWEPGFVFYQWIISKVSSSHIFFMAATVLSILFITLKGLKKIVPQIYIPLIFIGYLSLFYYFNFLRNIIRQGFAVSFILLIIVFLAQEKTKQAVLYFFLAISFHISAVISSLLFVVRKFNISIKLLCIFYIIGALTMLTGINQKIMSQFSMLIGGRIGSSIARYASDSLITNYGSSNRIDFLLFTSFWLILGVCFYKYFLKKDYLYESILKAYITFSTIFVIFGYIGYSDRLAAYAWYLIPIIHFYPIIKMKGKYKILWIFVLLGICIGMFYFFDVSLLYQKLKLIY